ncbi:MAG: hypothetical protein LBI72_07625 [Flavobacteriaceae bacterium]|jgi:antitoxin component YwqK of YwqJK toxin-antitoxin module|nr:hypothetical protein [Flavobacteriaceae bacterium]
MKNYVVLLCLGLTMQCYAQKVVPSKALSYDKGLRYESDKEVLFTGIVRDYFLNGLLKKEEYLEKGVGVKGKEFDVEGNVLSEYIGAEKKEYTYNGILLNYKNDSIEQMFYTNGRVYQENIVKNKGEVTEECRKIFDINGQLIEQKNIHITKVMIEDEESDEVEVTTKEFYVTGELFRLEKHNQTNGEMYVKYYHLNGTIMTEFPLKEFKRTENKKTKYYANGQIYSTIWYNKDDEEENVKTYREDGTLLKTETYTEYDSQVGSEKVENYYDKEGKLIHTVKGGQGAYYYDISDIKKDKLYCQIGSVAPFTGTEKLYYSNGLLHKVVDFVEGKVVGESKEYREDGRLHEISQQTINDRVTKTIIYHENGVMRLEYGLKYGSKEGLYEYEQYSSQGVKEAEGVFIADERLIRLTKYHVNTGHIASIECALEEERSITETYRPDGQMIAMERRLGRYQDGLTEMIAEDGLTKVELEFKNGVKHGLVRLFIKGTQILDMKYKDGKVDGVVKMYGLNGQLKMEANYKEGTVVGKVKEYKIDKGAELSEDTLRLISIMFW